MLTGSPWAGKNQPLSVVCSSSDWKLITGLGSGGFTKPGNVKPQAGEPAVQLYNLRTDPGETTNLAAEQPERVAALQAALQATVAPR